MSDYPENKLIYLPAVMPAKALYNTSIHKKKPHFWNKESIWNYDYMLVSAFFGIEQKITNIREYLEISDDVHIKLDSGGYQCVTQGKEFSPQKVINWQMNSGGDSGLILDRPPYNFGGGAQFTGSPTTEFFSKSLETTYNNAKVALEINNKPDLQEGEKKIDLYGVIQGESWEQALEWYEKIHSLEQNGFEFQAWALSPKPSDNIYKIAMYGILAMEMKINKPLHFLQISGKKSIIIAAYIQYLLGQTITIDSSTFKVGSRYGAMMIDYTTPLDLIKVGREMNKENKGNGWLCNCSVCQELNIGNENWHDEFLRYIDIHNLKQIDCFVKYCSYIVHHKDLFIELINRSAPSCLEIIKIFDY